MKSDNKTPPFRVWVSYCARCGWPILATIRKTATTCPTCSIVGLTKAQRPPIRFARYERVRR